MTQCIGYNCAIKYSSSISVLDVTVRPSFALSLVRECSGNATARDSSYSLQ